MNIRKNDEVVVIAGKNKGQRGKVLRVLTDRNKVLVEKVNLVKRHTKPSQANPAGGIVTKEAPIHVSNVNLYDAKSNGPSRIGSKTLEDGSKARVLKKSGDIVETKE
jgi:large subunit ribosomal protein L24